MNPDLNKATKLARGVTLFTKDGRQNGNAIVIQKLPSPPEAITYLNQTNQSLWLVETDFGNQMRLTDNEITERFYLGFEQDYAQWWNDRLETIQKTEF